MMNTCMIPVERTNLWVRKIVCTGGKACSQEDRMGRLIRPDKKRGFEECI
jgi:hypothetical protein